MDDFQKVEQLLREHGAGPVRDKKHKVWGLPNGRTFVMPQTPSDKKAVNNSLSDARRFLGLVDPDRGQPGERRPKKVKGPAYTPPQNKAATPVQKATTLDAQISALLNEIRSVKQNGRR